jgi:hypothetical protein
MSDLGFPLLFVAIALAIAWLVNSLVALLSGEHPRNTQGVWLDIVLGELRGLSSVFRSTCRPWLRWTIVAIVGIAVFGVLFFAFYAK